LYLAAVAVFPGKVAVLHQSAEDGDERIGCEDKSPISAPREHKVPDLGVQFGAAEYDKRGRLVLRAIAAV
jgi:hypothetical protein